MQKLKAFLLIFIVVLALAGCRKDNAEPDDGLNDVGPISGGKYYVAPWGDDEKSGSYEEPWATWQKAFNMAEPGDTVYFRGGTYTPEKTTFQAAICLIDPTGAYHGGNPRGKSGTADKPICYFNYPKERPVLDCRKTVSTNGYLGGISLYKDVHYIHFKGLEIKNVWQKKHGVSVNGISMHLSSNITFENMVVHDIGGRGYWLASIVGHYGITSDTIKLINCDIYNCADTLKDQPFNMGDGVKGDVEPGGILYFEGVRVWNCSDDGLDLSGTGQKIIKSCWAFNIGVNFTHIYKPDDGNGFKLGGVRDTVPFTNWIMTNSISAGNYRYAIHMLDYKPYYRNNARVYNNIFYKNEDGPASFSNSPKPFYLTEFRNNISYNNNRRPIALYDYKYPESHNTWDWSNHSPSFPYLITDTVTVTDEDFVSVDIEQLKAPRNEDFSLPDVAFMKLVSTSDLIDAGIDVGLPYSGKAPDIGAFESN